MKGDDEAGGLSATPAFRNSHVASIRQRVSLDSGDEVLSTAAIRRSGWIVGAQVVRRRRRSPRNARRLDADDVAG
ncbi:hypothetical protein BJI67_13660 [Acidihalobacter aeolianus]|uniref:Uncharacterized protein n=1 Tax=Acidihalobacter aeolianus TaxID=2792603 RepID=A0A1D8KAK9_9GAMM|nr:hypothetical protein BJI67_13660 [Acidihalobacter aeolianus]